MARAIALATTLRLSPLEALRAGIVCGCALALIVAHYPF